MAGDVIVERQQGGIAVVTLARPEARNAMTLDMRMTDLSSGSRGSTRTRYEKRPG